MTLCNLKTLSNKITELPLWIKQIFYIELKEELESAVTKNILDLIHKDNCVQLYLPKITFEGKKEIESKSGNFPPYIYDLLESISKGKNIIEISVENNWCLVETSSYFINAVNSGLIQNPEISGIQGSFLYLSGHIRIGEYFVKLGKITIEKLDDALRIQKYLEEATDDKMGLREVLINFGFVTKEDVDGILLLKEEGKKRFIPDKLVNTDNINENTELVKLSEQISLLIRENNQLKEQIRQILNIIK